MNRKHNFEIDEYYHIYNRGTDKRIIFLEKHDYHRFILLLYFCNSREPVDLQLIFREGRTFAELFNLPKGKSIVAIGAWCLMPNHFHLLLKETVENGITEFMRKVSTGYSVYFNNKYNRSGSLFQGKFKSEHLNNDRYLKYIFSYIHLNPIKLIPGESKWTENGIKKLNEAEKFLKQYEYSSFNSYAKERSNYSNMINKSEFPEYFPAIEDSVKEIREWLDFKDSAKVRPSQ